MTTTVKVHVNGKYRANLMITRPNGDIELHVVEGNYEGSPNPSGEFYIVLYHPAQATFEISEEEVT